MVDPRDTPVVVADQPNTSNENSVQYAPIHTGPAAHVQRTPRQSDDADSDDEEGMDVQDLTEEDAESVMGVSISAAAMHLASAKTPAAEKTAVMEDLDGGGLFESDEDVSPSDGSPLGVHAASPTILPDRPQFGGTDKLGEAKISTFPEPSHAGPKIMSTTRPEETRAAMRDAMASKRRSFSGSGEALRKLLPSMPKAGSFMPSLPSPPFFGNNQKTRNRASTGGKPGISSSDGNNTTIPQTAPIRPPLSRPAPNPTPLNNLDSTLESNFLTPRPPLLRRVTSDQSLLYTSLSRTSSLGDDSRFEHQHEMVNSRMKAIMDSLQDRSTFRLPQMPRPSIPSMPNFDFSMPFGLSNGIGMGKANSADSKKDILPGRTKKKSATFSTSGSSTPREGASDPTASSLEGNNDKVFDRAIANLTGDVVIMGGYRGSILRSAKPPHRQLWVPVKVGLNIRKVNMEVGLEDEDEERMEESIFASGMLQNIGPVDISRRLFKRLRESENAKNGTLRVWDYGYDWRLSPHLLSKKLQTFLEGLPCNKLGQEEGALVIAHSLGGMITRHVVNQRPELFSGVVYAGVPETCINILGPLRNGDAVLFSSRVLTAQVNFTLRTSFLLLPLDGYGFIDKKTKESYLVDFFNVDDWVKYRFSPCTDPPLPPYNPPNGGLAQLLLAGSLSSLQLPGRKASSSISKQNSQGNNSTSNGEKRDEDLADQSTTPAPQPARRATSNNAATTTDLPLAPQTDSKPLPTAVPISPTTTLARPAVLAYLARILPRIRLFKQQVLHDAGHESRNAYPPLAIIYGKSIPTVCAARVASRAAIACADVYDDLAFGSGDGVVLARDAQLPRGYRCVRGGRVRSERGHVTLLGDLEAVGRAVEAVRRGRGKGIGLGKGKGRGEWV